MPMRRRRAFCWVGIVGLLAGFIQESRAADLAKAGVCMREGAKLAGMAPVQVGKQVTQPKKIRNVTPKYPALPAGTMVRPGGPWMGEILIDRQGTVVEVWSIREMSFDPLFPPFNRAIVDAMRQWKFEPPTVKRQGVPMCMTVTVQVNWA
jgi:hypothetical protein